MLKYCLRGTTYYEKHPQPTDGPHIELKLSKPVWWEEIEKKRKKGRALNQPLK